MSAEWRSTDAASSDDQTSPDKGECSGIAFKIDTDSAGHSPRKRRLSCQPGDVDNHSQDKKRNTDLDLQSTQKIFERGEVDLMQTQASSSGLIHSRNTSLELVQTHQKSEEKEVAGKTTFHERKTEVKSNYNIELLTTTGLSNQVESLFKYLLKYPNLYDQDVDGDTLLHLAIVHKKVNLILATILAMEERKQEDTKARGVNIQNKLRQTGLHLAVLTCQPGIVKFLLEHGADVNATDRNGHAGLHLACKNADVENIRAMRIRKTTAEENNESSIDINLKNFEGLAPIHLATLTGSCEVIAELLDMGADIDTKDSKSGRTALHHAVEAQNPIVTKMLLSRNADVNAQTFAGNTALHTASGHRMENIIYILLEFEADRKLTNFEGDLPLPETYMPYAVIRKLTQKSKEKKQK